MVAGGTSVTERPPEPVAIRIRLRMWSGVSRKLRRRTITSNSINILGALENVSQAVGQPADEARQLYDEGNRWTAVEDELRKMLSGVAGATISGRQRVSLIATQASNIGSELARDPANAILVPHVLEIRRLKSLSRRKKGTQAGRRAGGAGI